MHSPSIATPCHTSKRIIAGDFRRKIGYRISRPRGTNDWLLIYTVRGAGEFGYGTHEKPRVHVVAAPGDAVLLRPGTLHDYRVHRPAKRWDLLWAHFHPRPHWQAWLDWPAVSPSAPGLMRLSIGTAELRQSVERALLKMNEHALGSHPLSTSMAMNALEEVLLGCARQLLRGGDHDPRIEQAEEYLCQHLREKVTRDDLADVIGLSSSRLSYLFRKQTGITPQQYLEQQRLERARQLLELTNLPVKAIATDVGFDNPFYFTLRFKRYLGSSPRQYRENTGKTMPPATTDRQSSAAHSLKGLRRGR